MRKSVFSVFIVFALSFLSALAFASDNDVLGSVSTNFKAFGPNDKVVLTAFDDPDVKGVTCYLSSAKTGGFIGAVGLATDSSDASVSCIKTDRITFYDGIENGAEVFSERRSVLFKELHVVRFIDRKRNVIIYMSYSDRLVDGSPKNSISAVSYDSTLNNK